MNNARIVEMLHPAVESEQESERQLLAAIGRHDSRRYAQKAATLGGPVQLDIFAGLHHVFQRSTVELATARRALDATAQFIARYWSEEPPAGRRWS